jgi:tRNA-dihydrouridine synthase B
LDSTEKVVHAFRRYPVDGVMIARAALGRPWLFRQIQAALRGEPVPPDPSAEQQRDVLLQHFGYIVTRFGSQRGTVLMRKYACCYAQGRPGARQFRGLVAHVRSPEEFHQVVLECFPRDPTNAATTDPAAEFRGPQD